MSGGTLSIIKLPNRRINYSESEDVFSHIMQEKQKKIYLNNNYDYTNEEKRKSSSNLIYENKIFIEKLKPETKKDYYNKQAYDTEINNYTRKTFENKRINKEEIKEIEIMKRREKEKNKKIQKYKKNYEKIKNMNKLNTLKHAIQIIEYHKKIIFKKILEKFRQNAKNLDKKYEIKIVKNINKKLKPKPKKKKSFNKLLITENRSVSFNAKSKSPTKENIIISNDKLNIISNIKKEEFGSQIGQWQTKIEKVIKNDINIINTKPKLIEKGIQYKTIDNKITKSKLNIISKISKEQSPKKWNSIISKTNTNIKIINSKPQKVEESSQCSNIKNTINKNEEIKIIQKRPTLVDDEIQHEPSNS